MTKPALAKLCAIWQERLLLQDWGVVAEFSKDLTDCGRITWDKSEMTAAIVIKTDTPEMIESTLVHELLHLRLCRVKVTAELENVINLLARTFIKAYRRNRKPTKEKS